MSLLTMDFESIVSAIPPLRHELTNNIPQKTILTRGRMENFHYFSNDSLIFVSSHSPLTNGLATHVTYFTCGPSRLETRNCCWSLNRL